jgi:ribosomal protein S1
MNFVQLFKKSNSSLNQLQGNVLDCSVSEIRGDLIVVETGLTKSSVCFKSELNTSITKEPCVAKQHMHAGLPLKQACIIGIEQVESTNGEPLLVYPKLLQKICRRKLVWSELTKIWRSSQNNRIKGFILNSVKGGYAIAIAGYIAFLPKSLRIQRKVYRGQWRKFSILNMNPKIGNIVVKEYSFQAPRNVVPLKFGSFKKPKTKIKQVAQQLVFTKLNSHRGHKSDRGKAPYYFDGASQKPLSEQSRVEVAQLG